MKYLPQRRRHRGISFYSSPLHQNFHDVSGAGATTVFSDKDHLNARYDYQLFTNQPVYDPTTNILSYADGSDIIAQNALIAERLTSSAPAC